MRKPSQWLLVPVALCLNVDAFAFNGRSRPSGPAPGVGRQISPLRLGAGTFHTCVTRPDGSVRCWGSNRRGALGDGTTTDRLTPVPVAGLTNAVAVTGGTFFSCALLADGTVRCWGINLDGQLGDGTTTERRTPVTVAGLAHVIDVAAGLVDGGALLVDGTVRCWVDNFN